MTRAQILTLVVLAVLVCVVLGFAAFMVRSLLEPPSTTAQQPPTPVPIPLPPATWTPIPMSTFTPTPVVDTPSPSPTNTRVVPDTPTPTPSPIPTSTPTATSTPVATRPRAGGSSPAGVPQPTQAAGFRYPLRVVEGPVVYDTKNYMFVVLAKVASGGTLLPGYRLAGTHSPSGANVQSAPSCDRMCKASGPKGAFPVQEGNLAFEAFFYDTGTWSLILLDPRGQQASEVFQVNVDRKDRKWFYIHFNH